MTDEDIINNVITDHLELKVDDPYIADKWVPRLERYLNDIVGDLTSAIEWDWLYVHEEISIPAGGKLAIGSLGLSRGFSKMGEQGSIIPTTSNRVGKVFYLRHKRFFEYYDRKSLLYLPDDVAEIYTIHGFDPTTASPFLYRLPVEVAAQTYAITYIPTFPDADYSPTPPATGVLGYIPEDFHITIQKGMEDLCSSGADDGRDMRGKSARYASDLKRMISTYQQEHPFEQYGDDGIPDMGMF